jgi:hypothetical protein
MFLVQIDVWLFLENIPPEIEQSNDGKPESERPKTRNPLYLAGEERNRANPHFLESEVR